MNNPRCPECDIELDCTTDRWVCPLCRETPRPEQYVHSLVKTPIIRPAHEWAIQAAELLIAAAEDEPALVGRLGDMYRKLLEIAESD